MLFGVYLLIRKRAVLRYIFACWRFMLACWLTYVYFNVFSNNVNKKMTKKALFLATENIEIFLDRIDTVFLDTDLRRLTLIVHIVSNRGLARIYQVRCRFGFLMLDARYWIVDA